MMVYPVSKFIDEKCDILSDNMYGKISNFSRNHDVLARGLAPIVSAIDVSFELIKTLTVPIEHVALAIINLLGCMFSNRYTFRDSMKAIRMIPTNLSDIYEKVLALPFDFVFQTYYVFKSPERTLNLSYNLADFLPVNEN
jgi:hypothetical protein